MIGRFIKTAIKLPITIAQDILTLGDCGTPRSFTGRLMDEHQEELEREENDK